MPVSTAPPSLSIFFAADNDSGTIGSLVIRALQVTESLTPDYEVMRRRTFDTVRLEKNSDVICCAKEGWGLAWGLGADKVEPRCAPLPD